MGGVPDDGDHDFARRMFNAAHEKTHTVLQTLQEARAHPEAAVILQGDDGGQIYVTCPVSRVRCAEPELQELLTRIDRAMWDDRAMASLHFEVAPVQSAIAGGMGGGVVTDGVWVHRRIDEIGLADVVRDVVYGLQPPSAIAAD
jgi:FMN phosphatase YigB (HAD superfamily)